MAIHNVFGKMGEDEACLFLALRDYTLLDRNWRSDHLEIDIVADYFGELVFVEVKTRRNEYFGYATDAVDTEKRRHLLEAAKAYMAKKQLDQPYRFDVITVVGERRPFTIRQYVNAFNAMGVYQHPRSNA